MNTIGTFQAYLVPQQLAGYIEADIGWIFGLYLFMAYCCGVQTGPIFDAGPDTHSHHYLDTYIVLKCRPPDAVWTLNNYSAVSDRGNQSQSDWLSASRSQGRLAFMQVLCKLHCHTVSKAARLPTTELGCWKALCNVSVAHV